MTHRPNAMTRSLRVLPGVVRHTFIIFGLFTTLNLCPLAQNPGDATAPLTGLPLELGIDATGQETRVIGLPMVEEVSR